MFYIFYPTASATAYGRRPKFVRAEHSATAEGENCAYGPTLPETSILWKADDVRIDEIVSEWNLRKSKGFCDQTDIEAIIKFVTQCLFLRFVRDV